MKMNPSNPISFMCTAIFALIPGFGQRRGILLVVSGELLLEQAADSDLALLWIGSSRAECRAGHAPGNVLQNPRAFVDYGLLPPR
jgi:hypothetical protein